MGRPAGLRRGREEDTLTAAGLVLAAALDIVVQGQPRVRVETDGSPPARYAADLVKRYVVLLSGTALPDRGAGAALRFERTAAPGYEIRLEERRGIVRGADLVRAAYDVLEGWGCRFEGAEPQVPRRSTLALEARTWRPERALFVEAERFDPSVPASGVAVRGLDHYRPERLQLARRLGYEIRVASTTFDDFLPPALFEEHPEWFALRRGRREPRGNFAILNPQARAAYLDRLGGWLDAHAEVDCVGIWPEVTSVWDEEAGRSPAEAYARLWREAAARFPGRRFEILATGLTLAAPAGPVPANVEVRLRPGRAASALQGIAGQEIERVIEAWEARGARVLLEIDANPASWCGMPWPCHDAVRENARRLRAAVLRGGGRALARIWRDPEADPVLPARLRKLLQRAASVRSWGHPRDAADLFFEEEFGVAFKIGAVERLFRIASDAGRDRVERETAAADAYLGFRVIAKRLPPGPAAQYRRYRARDYRRLIEELLPGGVEHEVGPARVTETFDRLTVETDRLRFGIDRRTATVVSLRRRLGRGWSADLAGEGGRFFAVVALAEKTERTAGEVWISSPGTGRVRIDLKGRLRRDGPGWSSRLELSNASGLVRQSARVDAAGGIAAGCRWTGPVFDRWVCPPYAVEGRLEGAALPPRGLRLPRGTLLYCRDGERGPGLAARAPDCAVVSLVRNEATTLVATHPSARELRVDWIVFTDPGELGR